MSRSKPGEEQGKEHFGRKKPVSKRLEAVKILVHSRSVAEVHWAKGKGSINEWSGKAGKSRIMKGFVSHIK